ncbi:MAG: T9SS type A sorting domain-containing protein [Bacteroidia bacterium]|nr:T9SS type A sorting domain-containing protein [Bacteroidia bacterium]
MKKSGKWIFCLSALCLVFGSFKAKATGTALYENSYMKSQGSISYVVTPISCQGNDGQINITVNGATPPYTYLWSNGATTEDLAGIGVPDTYTVTVTDGLGVIISSSIIVDFAPGIMSLTYDVTIVGCLGNIDLTVNNGTSPFTYHWSTGATTEDLASMSPGIYTVTVTDNSGCIRIKQIEVALPPAAIPDIAITNVSNCVTLSDGSADLSLTGGVTPFSYIWSNGFTTQDLINVQAGNYYVTITDFCGSHSYDTAIILTPAAITFSFDRTPPDCSNNFLGSITPKLINAALPVSYHWSDGASTADITGVAGGLYQLSVTDSHSCTASSSVELAGISQPYLNIHASDTLICSGQIIQLSCSTNVISSYNMSALYQYEPNVPINAGVIADNKVYGPFDIGFTFGYWGGVFTRFYIGANGWIGFEGSPAGDGNDPNLTVQIPSSLPDVPKNCIMACWRDWNPEAGPLPGQYVNYGIFGSSPNRRLLIYYQNIPTYSCPSAGSFQIELFESSNNIHVNLINVPTCNQWQSGNGVFGIHSYNGSQAITNPGMNNTPWTAANTGYQFTPVIPITWYQNSDSIGTGLTMSVNPPQTTVYKAVCSTSCGVLIDSVTVVVDSPNPLSIAGDTSICAGDTITLTATAGYDSYTWSDGSTGQEITVAPIFSSTYHVDASTAACTRSADAFIQVTQKPVLNLGPDQSLCLGQTVSLTVNPALGFTDYLWSTGATTNSITDVPASDGTYTYSLIATNLCVSDTDTVQVNISEALSINLGNDSTFCYTGPITLDAGPGFLSYYWSTGSTHQSITVSPTEATEYTVFAIGPCNHYWDTITINPIYPPVADFYYNAVTGSFVNTSQYFASCTWNFGDGSPVSHEVNPVHVYDNDGAYYVYLYIENLCGHDFIIYRIVYTGVEELSAGVFNIYPNPAVNFVMVDQGENSYSKVIISIEDITGKELIRAEVSGQSNRIDTRGLADGIYFLNFTGEHITRTTKVIISRK